MRPVLAAGVLLALAFGTAAAPYTTAFDGLKGALENRRDNDFGGTLDNVLKAKQKAVLKCLARLDKPADDLADDLKTAGFVVKALEKAYADEFSGPVLSVAGLTLPGHVDASLAFLQAEVTAGLEALVLRVNGLSTKGLLKVGKAIGAAQAALQAENASRSDLVKHLLAAWKQIVKGNKAADRDPGGAAEGLTYTVNGGPSVATTVHADVFQGDDGLQISGFVILPGVGSRNVYVTVPGVTGPGMYMVAGTGHAAAYIEYDSMFNETDWNLQEGSGTLVLDTFDPAGNGISGHFDFTAVGPSTLSIHADFTVKDAIDVNPGSLP